MAIVGGILVLMILSILHLAFTLALWMGRLVYLLVTGKSKKELDPVFQMPIKTHKTNHNNPILRLYQKNQLLLYYFLQKAVYQPLERLYAIYYAPQGSKTAAFGS